MLIYAERIGTALNLINVSGGNGGNGGTGIGTGANGTGAESGATGHVAALNTTTGVWTDLQAINQVNHVAESGQTGGTATLAYGNI